MAARGGVTPPHIREKQKRPSEDEREKIPKNQKSPRQNEGVACYAYLSPYNLDTARRILLATGTEGIVIPRI